MANDPANPSSAAIKYSEKQISPSGPLYQLATAPAPGQSPNRLPDITPAQWAAMPKSERFQRLYENGIQLYYTPAQRAKRAAYRAKTRQARRARAVRDAAATRAAYGAPPASGPVLMLWPTPGDSERVTRDD